MLKALIQDDRGFVVSIELIMIATIAIIGLMAGLSAVRDGVVSEISDVAGGVQDFNQSYRLFGVEGHSGATAGGDFLDARDFCDEALDDPNDDEADNCIRIADATMEEGDTMDPP